MNKPKIYFIGAGKMAAALARGMVETAGADSIAAFDKSADASRLFIEKTGAAGTFPLEAADIVILAVKPQHLASATAGREHILKDKLIVSILAGTRIEQLQEKTGSNRIVRVMPNISATIGAGVSGVIKTDAVGGAEFAVIEKLLEAAGVCEYFSDEHLFDVVTALSGSGPAFVFEFIKALADGAVTAGMPQPQALRLAAATVEGAARMVRQGEDPSFLRNQVMSPGGTTAEGIRALEMHGFRSAVIEAVIAAARKSRDLGGK